MAAKKKPTRKKSPSKKKAPTKKVTRKKVVSKRAAGKKAAPAKAATVNKADPRVERLKTLMKLIEKSNLCELAYEDSDIRVNLKQGQVVTAIESVMPTTIVSPSAAPASAPTSTSVESVANENADDLHIVSSPFVGTFYTSPAPDTAPYTGVGQTVNKGQTVCIVEAMKLMNEIEAEVSGVVVEILAENAQGVQYGDPLFKIKVS